MKIQNMKNSWESALPLIDLAVQTNMYNDRLGIGNGDAVWTIIGNHRNLIFIFMTHYEWQLLIVGLLSHNLSVEEYTEFDARPSSF